MSFEAQSLTWLADKIEKWISASPKRNLSTLQRKTGVSYSTLRRAATKESLPNESAILSILSVVADSEEIISFLKETNPIFHSFYVKTLLHSKNTKTEEAIAEKLLSKDSFICFVLAYTIGAKKEDVERLLGSVGVNTLYSLCEEGYLKEDEDGVMTPNSKNPILEVFNQTVYKQISAIISQLAVQAEQGQNMYFFYNVTKDAENQIKAIFAEAEAKALEIARKNEGNIPLMHSLVTTNIFDLETAR